MKKNYENPIIEVLELEIETATDLSTTNGNETDINPDDSWWS